MAWKLPSIHSFDIWENFMSKFANFYNSKIINYKFQSFALLIITWLYFKRLFIISLLSFIKENAFSSSKWGQGLIANKYMEQKWFLWVFDVCKRGCVQSVNVFEKKHQFLFHLWYKESFFYLIYTIFSACSRRENLYKIIEVS